MQNDDLNIVRSFHTFHASNAYKSWRFMNVSLFPDEYSELYRLSNNER
jgi:hypothetical protein